jgi:Bifunctional DNA primase/polymerase, N-terminal
MKSKKSVLHHARKYLRSGWQVIPVPYGEKAPAIRRWQDLLLGEEDLPERFGAKANIGVLLGEASHGLVDVDLDCEEAIRLAPYFLPETDCIHGRKSKRSSHYWYFVKESLRPEKFNDVDGSCLLELRFKGQQTIVPPSIHPSGEQLRWERSGKPARVSAKKLLWDGRRLAAASILARHWPGIGSRNYAALALAGILLRAGWEGETARHFIGSVAMAANDEQWKGRGAVVKPTRKKIDRGEKTTGLPTLAKLLGEKVAHSACDWLGIRKKETGETRVDGSASHATQLVILAQQTRLFHTVEQEPFARIEIDGHRETWHLKSPHFKRWLAARFYQSMKIVPSTQALNDALGVLEGKALYESREKEVFSRLAERDGKIYLDLCDPSWQAVEITTSGWRVVSNPPIRFRRSRGMLALPIPEQGGSISELRPFLNVGSEDDFLLLISWLIGALSPLGPYPVLVLQGEAGSAKSTTARVLRELVDPSTAPLRSEPREVRDLMIAAKNSWVVAFDNVAYQPAWLSDALCRMATGGGFSTRELYSDDQEKVFNASRPVLLNGIEAVVTRGDLMDRSIIVYLPIIAEEQRKTERQFWQSFRSVQACILGALLDAVACALRRLPHVELTRQPRMADFARWAVAAGPALGLADGAFTRAYDSNRAAANVLTLEASLIVTPLRYAIAVGHWKGTALELLAKLNAHAGVDEKRERAWPKNPQQLSIQLRRLAPNLRRISLDIQFDEKTSGSGSKRLISITRRNPESSNLEFPERRPDQIVPYPPPIARFPRPFRFPRE